MSDLTLIRPAGSLIERTAASYDLSAFGRAPAPQRVNEPPAAFAFAMQRVPAQPASGPVATIDRIALAEAGMIVPGGSAGVLAEEFGLATRRLSDTAHALGDDPKARTILVASARVGEGKTFCAINLALSLAAQGDRPVLLVDGDVDRRALLPRLGLPNGPGLLDLLAEPALDPAALVMATDVPGLSLLGAGTWTNRGGALLASERTGRVLARLLAADPRRLVILDSPATLAATPAATLANHVGQVMFVVQTDGTPERQLRAAIARLDGCAHIQLLLNRVRRR